MKMRVIGVQAAIPRFNFLFRCSLGAIILKQADNLSWALQNSIMSAAEVYALAQDVVKTLLKGRNDDSYNLSWERLLLKKIDLGISEPKLPRKCNFPDWFDLNNSSFNFHDTPKDRYRQSYFEAYDCVIKAI